jgi:MoxR-like ATPase
LAKTLLIKTFADVLDLSFKRIQFTPDLMPSDITGTEILQTDKTTGEKVFKFIQGPVFANVILADEINRTPPKTQAALLEAMQEGQVTASGRTFDLPKPFFVLATQNPIEQEGTYLLPEAQLDRFMFNLHVDYPAKEEEIEIVKRTTVPQTVELEKVVSREELQSFIELVLRVPVADNLIKKTVEIVSATRPENSADEEIKKRVQWGAGPRASQFMILAAKTRAVLYGRFTPNEEDLRNVALPVLRHRVIPSFAAEAEGITSEDIIKSVLNRKIATS